MSETEILTVRHDHTDKVRKLGCPACMVLQDVLAEVRRLRAAVEAVRALPDAGVCSVCGVARICPICHGTDAAELEVSDD